MGTSNEDVASQQQFNECNSLDPHASHSLIAFCKNIVYMAMMSMICAGNIIIKMFNSAPLSIDVKTHNSVQNINITQQRLAPPTKVRHSEPSPIIMRRS